MPTVLDIFRFLDEIAPVQLAEDYDNPGILAGNPSCSVTKALLSLDITPKTAQEAADCGAQLVISHHPVIFKPVKAVLSTGGTAAIWSLAQLSLSAICMHTNLDAAIGGVNDALAEKLGLRNVTQLGAYRKEYYKKITVFVPVEYSEKLRAAMAEAGAGKLGEYDGCAFEVNGKGHFRPLQGANPFIGTTGTDETVEEVRLEAICESGKVKKVIEAMLNAHPYEMPAYDIFDDEAVSTDYGMGRFGSLEQNMPLRSFAQHVKEALSTTCVKVVDSGKQAQKIAVCGGSADGSFLSAALKAGADTVVTGEMKHSLYYEAMEDGLNVVEAGHFATETVILPVLRQRLSGAFPQVSFEIATTNVEPYYSV